MILMGGTLFVDAGSEVKEQIERVRNRFFQNYRLVEDPRGADCAIVDITNRPELILGPREPYVHIAHILYVQCRHAKTPAQEISKRAWVSIHQYDDPTSVGNMAFDFLMGIPDRA